MDYLQEAKNSYDASTETSYDLAWTVQAVDSLNSSLIAIAEQLAGINDNLDLLRQAIELVIDGEPIDDSPIDDADLVTCSVCLARLDKCECVDKVPRQ